MICSRNVNGWAKNRTGMLTNQDELPHYTRDSLTENSKGINFTETFGNKDFFGIVGFIDLKGYSSFSSNKTGKEISEFIKPFLTNIIKILTEHNALIDKTIGDEIMFIIPQIESGFPMQFDLLQILRKINDFILAESNYRFRIGISIGMMYLDVIETQDYTEWYVSGEPIIIAKRIMGIRKLKNPKPCAIAIAALEKDMRLIDVLKSEISVHEPCKFIPIGKNKNYYAKGIGKVKYQYYGMKLT